MSGGDICVTETEGGDEVSRETYYDLLGSQQDLGFFVAFVGGVVMLLAFGSRSSWARAICVNDSACGAHGAASRRSLHARQR